MRHSETEPGQNAVPSRTDGWNPELADAARVDAEAKAAADAAADADAERADRERGETAAYPDDRATRPADRVARLADRAASRGGASSWQDIKSRFVDDPAGAIAAAEELVRADVDQKIRALHDEADAMLSRLPDEDETSTETLRTRLVRYQQYCDRLASSTVH